MKFQNLNKQKGQGLTEYAVVLSLVAVAGIAAMAFFGGAVKSKIGALSSAISGDTAKVTTAEGQVKAAADKANATANKVDGMGITTKGEDSEVLEGLTTLK